MARLALVLILVAGSIILVLSSIDLLYWYGSTTPTFPWRADQDGQVLNGSRSPQVLSSGGDRYLIGVGKADITGPVVEINLMGYADPAQLGTGLRQRLYSRAFIIGNVEIPEDRFVYLVLDTQSGDTAVRHGILEALADKGGEYGSYGQHNVAVTGTHSHSGPGAWLNYLLPQVTSKGFNKPSYQAIVDGAVASIEYAHETLAPGRLSVGNIDVLHANINRSPYSYLANPDEERKRYQHDVDKTLTLLRFTRIGDTGETDIGVLTWFPVHGTSMYGNNTLITGDNKGVAARLFEKSTADPAFVAGFSQSNVGDTSPNVLGPYCESGDDQGLMCDFKTSLCANKAEPCHGRGPYFGRDDSGAASSYEIGRRQFEGARKLFDDSSAFSPVLGKVVKSVHQFVDLSTYSFPLLNGTMVRTCPAALGYSFAAGTSDGPGAFDFKQAQPGDPHANPLWSAVGDLIHTPNDTQKACHGDKVILLDVGESDNPYAWSPNIVDAMTLRVGNMFMIVSSGEASTMAGRRWKEALKETASAMLVDPNINAQEPIVVLGGPANTYSHYITTLQEYRVQRYEGASTLYGPHTLDAYINLTLTSLPHLSSSAAKLPHLDPGPLPPININASLTFITPVIVDNAPIFEHFGAITTDVVANYRPGDVVSAAFVGANPRNNFRLDQTFAALDKFDFRSKTWSQVRNDDDWSLVFEWERTSTVLGTSRVTISWETKWESDAWKLDADEEHGELLFGRDGDEDLKGLYRLHYYGDAKGIGGSITAFEGTSGEFNII